jgi:hypothetical protein
MKYFLRCLSTEFMKLRHTLAFWCILIGPAAITALMFLSELTRKAPIFPSDYNAWQGALDNSLTLWAVLFLPLYAALQSTLLAQLEHANQQWKYLYALPVPRAAYFAAKWAMVILVVAVTNILLEMFILAGGQVMQLIQPVWGYDAPIPWGSFAEAYAAITLAGSFIVSLHLLISLWWRSFIPSLAVGLIAAMSNLFIMSSDTYNHFDPYLFPVLALRGEGGERQVALIAGVAAGLALAVVGGWLFTRKQSA